MFKFANCKRLLVGGFNMKVSWDDSSQYMEKSSSNVPVTTSLPGRVPSPQPPPTSTDPPPRRHVDAQTEAPREGLHQPLRHVAALRQTLISLADPRR
jgi:hypothetical protein